MRAYRRAVLTGMTLVAAALLLSACPRARPDNDTATERHPEASIDWDAPLPGAHAVTFATAAADVPFGLHLPKGLGQPQRVLEGPVFTPPRDQAPGPTRVVALIYDSPIYGRVVLTEGPPALPPRLWHTMVRTTVEQNGRADVRGTATARTIRGGSEALVTVAEEGAPTVVKWLEGGVEYILGGPRLTLQAALKIAEAV